MGVRGYDRTSIMLRDIRWLRHLSPSEWDEAESHSKRCQFAAGTIVFEPTDEPRSVYLLESGTVRIFRVSKGGDEVTLGYVIESEVFGELPGFGAHPRESFAITRVPSVVWKIPLSLLRKWIESRPEVAIEISRQLVERLKRVEARVENLVFGDVRSRLAMALLELANDFGRNEGGRCVLEVVVPQGELATLIGSTRQSVNAAIAELREEGLLHQTRGRTELLDIARLREIGESGAN